MFRRNGDPELVMQVDDAILALRARLEILLESDFQMTDGEEENYRHLFSLAGVQFTQSSSLIRRFTEWATRKTRFPDGRGVRSWRSAVSGAGMPKSRHDDDARETAGVAGEYSGHTGRD
jgi:hypothetical protein